MNIKTVRRKKGASAHRVVLQMQGPLATGWCTNKGFVIWHDLTWNVHCLGTQPSKPNGRRRRHDTDARVYSISIFKERVDAIELGSGSTSTPDCYRPLALWGLQNDAHVRRVGCGKSEGQGQVDDFEVARIRGGAYNFRLDIEQSRRVEGFIQGRRAGQ